MVEVVYLFIFIIMLVAAISSIKSTTFIIINLFKDFHIITSDYYTIMVIVITTFHC
jgi:hypothetical protein